MSTISVHLGIWIDRSYNTFLGTTLTLSKNAGNIVIASLALFVAWTGASLWNIICYVVHQFRSTSKDRDGMYHQQQVTLRSGVTSSDAFWKFVGICWAWRSNTRNTVLRSCGLVLLAMLFFVGITAAGLFSSKLVSSDNQVLLQSSNCGWLSEQAYKSFNQLKPADLDPADALFLNMNWYFQSAQEYARSCYDSTNAIKSSLCDTYSVPAVQSAIRTNTSCPFENSVCTTPAFEMNSEMMDTNKHLGINTSPESALKFQKKTTCAPIHGDGMFDSPWTSRPPPRMGNNTSVPQEQFRYFNYGPGYSYGQKVGNETFFYKRIWSAMQDQEYILWGVTSFLGNFSVSDFVPIPQFNRTDADVTILALANLSKYSRAFNDPWFLPTPTPYPPTGPPVLWSSSTNMSFLGCTEQYQVCKGDQCIEPTGLYMIPFAKKQLNLSLEQAAVLDVTWKALWSTNLEFQRYFFGSNILLAKEKLYNIGMMSAALANRQWELEVANMHNISLAGLQARVIEFGFPQGFDIHANISALQFLIPASGTEQLGLCQSLKVRSNVHASFRVYAIVVLLLIGGLIRALSLLLPTIDFKLSSPANGRCHRHDEWSQSHIFQLQRRVFELTGIEAWTGRDREVPVTLQRGLRFQNNTEPVRRTRLFDSFTVALPEDKPLIRRRSSA